MTDLLQRFKATIREKARPTGTLEYFAPTPIDVVVIGRVELVVGVGPGYGVVKVVLIRLPTIMLVPSHEKVSAVHAPLQFPYWF